MAAYWGAFAETGPSVFSPITDTEYVGELASPHGR